MFAMTRKQWREMIQAAMPVRRRSRRRRRAIRTHARARKWQTCVGSSGRLTAKALTKSEARAQFKAALNLKRLPPGTLIVEAKAK